MTNEKFAPPRLRRWIPAFAGMSGEKGKEECACRNLSPHKRARIPQLREFSAYGSYGKNRNDPRGRSIQAPRPGA